MTDLNKPDQNARELFSAAAALMDRDSLGDSTLGDWFGDNKAAYAQYLVEAHARRDVELSAGPQSITQPT